MHLWVTHQRRTASHVYHPRDNAKRPTFPWIIQRADDQEVVLPEARVRVQEVINRACCIKSRLRWSASSVVKSLLRRKRVMPLKGSHWSDEDGRGFNFWSTGTLLRKISKMKRRGWREKTGWIRHRRVKRRRESRERERERERRKDTWVYGNKNAYKGSFQMSIGKQRAENKEERAEEWDRWTRRARGGDWKMTAPAIACNCTTSCTKEP